MFALIFVVAFGLGPLPGVLAIAIHSAGALGKQVWMMDRFDPCWRWLVGRRDSPWYPTLRIYRQPTPTDWASVIAAVAADLRVLAAGGAPAPMV